MAQAARLNLRMQKELKLLLSDPPLGASFPHLSAAASASASDTDLSSPFLSSIDAEIEGPEGTVYGGGIFKLRIQIPDRYPFQPPIVTFATPIYHPNIDNGGRICLDILNLPPKGAWQPSLNISTLITSITLLLTEPNPDDGLMCEASKEYKYNRQAFDLKARTMTEKYAKPGSDGSGSSSNCRQKRKLSLIEGKEEHGNQTYEEPKCAVNSNEPLSLNEQHFIGRKLSLAASRPVFKENDHAHVEATEAANYKPPGTNQKTFTENLAGAVKEDGHQEVSKAANFKTIGIGRKLSLHSLSQAVTRDAPEEANNEIRHQSITRPQSITRKTDKAQHTDDDQQIQGSQFNQSVDVFHLSRSKLCLSKRKLSLNRFEVQKE